MPKDMALVLALIATFLISHVDLWLCVCTRAHFIFVFVLNAIKYPSGMKHFSFSSLARSLSLFFFALDSLMSILISFHIRSASLTLSMLYLFIFLRGLELDRQYISIELRSLRHSAFSD